MTIREALIAMGYQERKPGHWLKPIGCQVFSYHEDKGEWVNWFKSGLGQVERWETKRFVDDQNSPYLKQLKEFECWSRTDMFICGDSEFHFSAIDI